MVSAAAIACSAASMVSFVSAIMASVILRSSWLRSPAGLIFCALYSAFSESNSSSSSSQSSAARRAGPAAADRRRVALAGEVARAVARGGLVEVRAVAVAAVDQTEEDHVRHGAAEVEADLRGHRLLVLALHLHVVHDDGGVVHRALLVRELPVAVLVALRH